MGPVHAHVRPCRDGVATGWHAATAAAASATAGAAESSRVAMAPGGDATGRSPAARQPPASGIRPRARQRTPLTDLAPAMSAPAVPQSARVRGAAVDGMDAGTLQLTRALHALQRSAAAVLADQLGPTGSRPPPEWGPLAGEAHYRAVTHSVHDTLKSWCFLFLGGCCDSVLRWSVLRAVSASSSRYCVKHSIA